MAPSGAIFYAWNPYFRASPQKPEANSGVPQNVWNPSRNADKP
jgi:hypothetical protein